MTTAPHEPIYASVAKPWLKYYDPKFFDQTPPECSAFEYVCRQNKTHLTETAITYYGRKITYADLIVNVKKTAAAFRAIGMKKGDIQLLGVTSYAAPLLSTLTLVLAGKADPSLRLLAAAVLITGGAALAARASLSASKPLKDG